MPEFLHEIVRKREINQQPRYATDPWAYVPVGSYVPFTDETLANATNNLLRDSYDRLVRQQLEVMDNDRRAQAIRAAVRGGHSAVTYPIGYSTVTGTAMHETITITDEMREQYADVSV